MGEYYGYPLSAWNEAKEEMREILINRAKQRSLISYSNLVRNMKGIKLEPDSFALFKMLGEISTEEDKRGRGMLSVIVVHKEGDMQPGKGFYNLANKLGRDVNDELVCWVNEFKFVFSYWNKSP